MSVEHNRHPSPAVQAARDQWQATRRAFRRSAWPALAALGGFALALIPAALEPGFQGYPELPALVASLPVVVTVRRSLRKQNESSRAFHDYLTTRRANLDTQHQQVREEIRRIEDNTGTARAVLHALRDDLVAELPRDRNELVQRNADAAEFPWHEDPKWDNGRTSQE